MRDRTRFWTEFLKRDLRSAEKLLEDEYCANNVLFHCQQAIEKGLKAIFEELNLEIPKTSSIVRLFSLLPDEIRSLLRFTTDQLKIFDEIIIDIGNPGETGILRNGFPTREKALNIYETTKRLVKTILFYLENM